MSRRQKSETGVRPGAFSPPIPADTQEVVQLFLIGARVVCEQPQLLDTVTERLGASVGSLVPPASIAAEECGRLWMSFARVAASAKPKLVGEAGRALYGDLEALCQRLDLPPLQDWRRVPAAVGAGPAAGEPPARETGADLDVIRARAIDRAANLGEDDHLPGLEVATLLTGMDRHARDTLFKHLVGEGILARGDCNMLAQVIVRGGTITEEDEALLAVLEELGNWLTRAQTRPHQTR